MLRLAGISPLLSQNQLDGLKIMVLTGLSVASLARSRSLPSAPSSARLHGRLGWR